MCKTNVYAIFLLVHRTSLLSLFMVLLFPADIHLAVSGGENLCLVSSTMYVPTGTESVCYAVSALAFGVSTDYSTYNL